MYYRVFAAALCGSLIACPALAQNTTEAAPKPPAEKKICRSQVEVGSIMRRTTCHTKAEWAVIDGKNQQAVDGALMGRDNARSSRPE